MTCRQINRLTGHGQTGRQNGRKAVEYTGLSGQVDKYTGACVCVCV